MINPVEYCIYPAEVRYTHYESVQYISPCSLRLYWHGGENEKERVKRDRRGMHIHATANHWGKQHSGHKIVSAPLALVQHRTASASSTITCSRKLNITPGICRPVLGRFSPPSRFGHPRFSQPVRHHVFARFSDGFLCSIVAASVIVSLLIR
jgi:hypothetical protein